MSGLLVRAQSLGTRVGSALASVTLLLLGVIAVVFAATVTYPFDPIAKLELKVVNVPEVGGVIIVELAYCKTRDWSPSEMRWALANNITIVLDTATVNLPLGCHTARIGLPVDADVPAGVYRLQVEALYTPWPWRQFSYLRTTDLFALVAPAKGER